MILLISDEEDRRATSDSYPEFLDYAAKQKPGLHRAPFSIQRVEQLISFFASAICVQVKYIIYVFNYNYSTKH